MTYPEKCVWLKGIDDRISMGQNFLDDQTLADIAASTGNEHLKSLIYLHKLGKAGSRLGLKLEEIETTKDDSAPRRVSLADLKKLRTEGLGAFKTKKNLIERKKIVVDLTEENLEYKLTVGEYRSAAICDTMIELKTPTQKPYIASLNIGSFGLNSTQNEIGQEYYEMGKNLVKYLRQNLDKYLFVNLIDCPNQPQLFEALSNSGYHIYFINYIFYSEGANAHRPDCGIAMLINSRLIGHNVKFLDLSLNLHQGGFPDYGKAFPQFDQKDLLIQPITAYLTCLDEDRKTVYVNSSIYVSAFSSVSNRQQSVLQSCQVLNEIGNDYLEKQPGCRIVTRLSGDFNPYGYDTLQGPLGKAVEPFAHLPAAVFGLATGFKPWKYISEKVLFGQSKNIPNIREVEKLRLELRRNGFVMQSDIYGQFEHTKTIQFKDMAPEKLKNLFEGAAVSWYLDFCVTPSYEGKVHIEYDLEPFGEVDHKTLTIQI